MSTDRQTTADAYYAEGCRLVEQGDRLWARANDPSVPDDMRRTARHAYNINAMRARTKFRRHDALLDAIQAHRLMSAEDEKIACGECGYLATRWCQITDPTPWERRFCPRCTTYYDPTAVPRLQLDD